MHPAAAEPDAADILNACPFPAGARAWYVNLFDDKGLVVSSEHRVAR
jgi:hypothetical protein